MRLLCLIALGGALWAGQPGSEGRKTRTAGNSASATKLLGVQIAMRDGVKLSTNVFLPAANGRFPAILERTPYGKGAGITPNHQAFVNRGYAVIAQDVRGRYASEGIFDPLDQEGPDGYDTLTWIARQPWCNGRIGMIGGSYRGIVQWRVAVLDHPNLKAIFPVVSGYDEYRDRFYSPGGAMKIGNRLGWMSENLKAPGYLPDFSSFVFHLPLRTADIAATGRRWATYQDALNHPAFDGFWKSVSTREQISRVRIPVFAVGGWYDNFGQSDLEAWAALRRASPNSRLIIGPWAHNMSYQFTGTDFGPEAQPPIRGVQLRWFDQWLKGVLPGGPEPAPLRLFIMGVNRWREVEDWPPAGSRPHVLYLSSGGRANTLEGDGALAESAPESSPPDRFVYDPHDPVPTRGGAVCCNPRVFPWGPMDQRPVERRKDVLVYSTAPLQADLEVIGPVRVTLWASTTARDTDFTAKLVDVSPDGYARNLTDGILRLRYRNSLSKPALAKPGHTYRLEIDAGVTGHVFRKGRRIRLEISSSNFPRFDRNANTGGRAADETRFKKATQHVFHDRQRPSHLILITGESEDQVRAGARSFPDRRARSR